MTLKTDATILWTLLFLVTTGVAHDARADGEFFQLDYAPRNSTFVASIQRDRSGAALGLSESEESKVMSVFLSYGFPMSALGDGTNFRIGPSVRFEEGESSEFGLRVSLEHYRATSWGSVFALADFNSINSEYLALLEVGHTKSGFAAFTAIQGDRTNFREDTVGISLQLRETRARLRLGHRLRARTTFIGISFNTF